MKFRGSIISKITILVFFVFAAGNFFAQKHDSLYVYEQIKNTAERSRFGKWVYSVIFVDPKPKEYPVQPESREEKIVNPYLKYEGCIIRNINIKVYDPFGRSIADTATGKINFLQRTGNSLHITSRHWVIRNKLLFEKNEKLNALSLSETERLLRQTGYVNDASVFVTDSGTGDSVDVNIIVQDKWAVSAPLMVTDQLANIRLRNENLLGMGHQFEQFTEYTRPDIMNYSGYYTVTNIDRTFISGQLFCQTNKNGTNLVLSFDRPFYSPLAKWAGGISLSRAWNFYSYEDTAAAKIKRLPLFNYGYDVWAGRAIKINARSRIFDQSTNIIIGERYYTYQYDTRPSFAIDTQRINLNTATFVGNLGFAVQQFYKDKFIYRFGANEDVPQGLIAQILYGVTKTEFKEVKYYLGGEIARAKHFKPGYFSLTISYGMFFNKFMSNDITTGLRLNYFTDLFRIGKWYLREFVNGKVVYGENKPSSDKLTLTSGEMYGFNSGSLSGNSKVVLNSETVAYAPYNLIGFRFAPVLSAGFGIIGDEKNSVMKSNLYQAYSLGLLTRNENLLSSTFEISVGFYPFLPNGNNNVVIYNPVTSFTLRVRAFSVNKPEFISY